jgi:hypothetical protein
MATGPPAAASTGRCQQRSAASSPAQIVLGGAPRPAGHRPARVAARAAQSAALITNTEQMTLQVAPLLEAEEGLLAIGTRLLKPGCRHQGEGSHERTDINGGLSAGLKPALEGRLVFDAA